MEELAASPKVLELVANDAHSTQFFSPPKNLMMFWASTQKRERERERERERDRGSRLPVISSRLRAVSEGYNPDHHFPSLSMPRGGSAAARHLELFSPTSGIRALVPALWLRRPTATFGSEKFLRIRPVNLFGLLPSFCLLFIGLPPALSVFLIPFQKPKPKPGLSPRDIMYLCLGRFISDFKRISVPLCYTVL
ncbi:hypothetical protein M9H77_18802 [Catharanthus roseus]|uniref:Uncharacterized protein n=1 Tax=Catharanthus roseus TaxID=4058 RepID=A0ACC0B8H4_CATRO|nr:hypothetical protein M9H77_18802 [Catharanthus roseus]